MRKIIAAVAVSFLVFSAVSAYNPPVDGEGFFELSSPKSLTAASSVAGGGIFSAGPDSIVVNPALTAGEQRVVLNAAYTAMFSVNEQNILRYGNAFQTGILIPSKWYIFSGYVNGTMVPFLEMNLGNSINIKAGLSKEISERLDVGLGLNAGLFWGAGVDWGISGNVGFVYKLGELGILKDFRVAASVLNLGKNYNNISLYGVDGSSAASEFPTIATIRIGAAALLYRNDIMKLGFSFDLSTPCFQNLILDAGLQFSLKDMLVLSVAEKINISEACWGHANYIPSVGLSFKFAFDVKNNAYLAQNDWSESEMTVSAAYKNIYSTVNAISAGVDINLGMQDTTPPDIKILFDDEE